MAETASEYAKRAMKCARLANLTHDDAIQKELLLLRQTYLTHVASLGLSIRDAIALGEEEAKTRIIGSLSRTSSIMPYLDVDLKYYDLSMESHGALTSERPDRP